MENEGINDIAFAAGRWPLDPERKTIVFIHGAGGSNLMWHHQVEACPPAAAKGDFAACSTFDVMDRLASIRTPVLVVASADNQVTPVKYGQYMTEGITGARMVTLEDAGHLAPLEKPEQFNQVVLDFMG